VIEHIEIETVMAAAVWTVKADPNQLLYEAKHLADTKSRPLA